MEAEAEAIIERHNGTVLIDGKKWHTREKFMATYGMKKSTFYNYLHSKEILSIPLFKDKNTIFFVYRMGGSLNG